jgi:hypothetical protein
MQKHAATPSDRIKPYPTFPEANLEGVYLQDKPHLRPILNRDYPLFVGL